MVDALGRIWERADSREIVLAAEVIAAWPAGDFGRLSALGVLKSAENATSVTCDACGRDHVEVVQSIESPPGSGLRAYIVCADSGRVAVPLERLRQWRIDYRALAERVARALSAAGDVQEIAPGRLWLLGKVTLGSRSREVFLARGTAWTGDGSVIAGHPRLSSSPSRLVLVAGALPPQEVWGGNPLVAALSAVVSSDDTELVVDRETLEGAATGGKRRKPSPATATFPTPKGTAWEDVRITMADLSVRIEVPGKQRQFTFQQAGFEDKKRRSVPDRLWALLKILAQCGGVLPFGSPQLGAAGRTNLRQNVRELCKRLAALMHIEGRPFFDSRRTRRYQTRFAITADGGLRFPTPARTTWDEVSITEVRPGFVSVAVGTVESFATFERAPQREVGGNWESAEREGELQHGYDLCALGLADNDGVLTAAGEALIALLRAEGKVQRPANDAALLALSDTLTRLMQIKASPFQYSPTGRIWCAHFAAASVLPRESR